MNYILKKAGNVRLRFYDGEPAEFPSENRLGYPQGKVKRLPAASATAHLRCQLGQIERSPQYLNGYLAAIVGVGQDD